MLEGVVTDEKSLRLFLCKKKKKKKEFKKLLHSFLQYPSSCSIRFSPVLVRFHGKNGFFFSCQWNNRSLFILLLPGTSSSQLNNSSQELSSHHIYIGFVQKKTHCSHAVQQLHGFQ